VGWIEYLDEVAAHPTTRAYRARARERLAIRRGERVLEIGCGTGGEARAHASAAGRGGLVVGIDRDAGLLAAAVGRLAPGEAAPRFARADALVLPFPDARFDAVVADRVLHLLDDPAPAVAELHRVLRPGGRALLSEPDWSTLSITPDSDPVTRRVERLYRHGPGASRAGRWLAPMMVAAGFVAVAVEVFAGLVDDYDEAVRLLHLEERLALVASGEQAEAWRASLRDAAARGTFQAALMGYTALGQRP
jgi:ubiquinone/menaquinone biosynthesis C-methylase UbiE